MKKCLLCGTVSETDAETCAMDGEATWAEQPDESPVVSEPVADAPATKRSKSKS